MKIKHLTLAFVAMSAANMAMADSGTINFTGQIVQDTCSTALTGGASSTAVTLPTVQHSTLATNGASTGETGFSLNVTGCEGANTRGIHFTLTPTAYDAVNNNLLGNTSTTNPASNVGIEIAEGAVGSATAINFVGTAKNSATVVINNPTNGSGSLPLTAKYKATGAATAGTVTAALGWSLVYN